MAPSVWTGGRPGPLGVSSLHVGSWNPPVLSCGHCSGPGASSCFQGTMVYPRRTTGFCSCCFCPRVTNSPILEFYQTSSGLETSFPMQTQDTTKADGTQVLRCQVHGMRASPHGLPCSAPSTKSGAGAAEPGHKHRGWRFPDRVCWSGAQATFGVVFKVTHCVHLLGCFLCFVVDLRPRAV